LVEIRAICNAVLDRLFVLDRVDDNVRDDATVRVCIGGEGLDQLFSHSGRDQSALDREYDRHRQLIGRKGLDELVRVCTLDHRAHEGTGGNLCIHFLCGISVLGRNWNTFNNRGDDGVDEGPLIF
jgi:hypothetical protein